LKGNNRKPGGGIGSLIWKRILISRGKPERMIARIIIARPPAATKKERWPVMWHNSGFKSGNVSATTSHYTRTGHGNISEYTPRLSDGIIDHV
jgi:hypothetical protein